MPAPPSSHPQAFVGRRSPPPRGDDTAPPEECGGDPRGRRRARGRLPDRRPAEAAPARPPRLRHEPEGRPGPGARGGPARHHRGIRPRSGERPAAGAGGESLDDVGSAARGVRFLRHPLRRVRRMRRRMQRWLLALGVVAVVVPTLAHAHPKPAVPAAKSGGTIYHVKEGDTLSGIAKRFGGSLHALIDAHRLPPRARPAPSVRAPANFVLAVPDLDGTALSFRWPVEGPISSPFGRRRTGWHGGIDIKAELGAPVFAAAGGRGVFSGWEQVYGRGGELGHH